MTYKKGYPVGSLSASSTLGIAKRSETRKMSPVPPLIQKVHIIDRGTLNPASLTSSAMCAAASEPEVVLASTVVGSSGAS